jgi:GntR family transcriptional regulator/MocR family aminotransferase
MLPFENLIFIDKKQAIPVFRQITDQMVSLIREGSLKPGIFLPGTRQMAQMLGVNRKTVIKSYDEMLGQNWIETILRKGYRVMIDLPLIKPRSFQPRSSFGVEDKSAYLRIQDVAPEQKIKKTDILIDDGFPDPLLSPCKEMMRIYHEEHSGVMLRRLMPLRSQGGTVELKSAVSSFLNDSRALNITSREIMMCRGGKMPLYLAANVLISPGDTVVVSQHTDPLSREILEHAGAELVEVFSDEDGIDTAHLADLLTSRKIKVLYVVPHSHYPTTSVLSGERRCKLLELMTQYGFWVIEDDHGYDFHYNRAPMLPLASTPHNGKMVYIGSFDRSISPSVSIGYLVSSAHVLQKTVGLQGLIDQHGDLYMEHLLLKIITSGGLERHLMRSRKMYAQRCELICGLLEEKLGRLISFERPQAGLAVYITFREQFPMEKFIRQASAQGLYFHDGVRATDGRSLRIGFASLSILEMETAVEIMARNAAGIIPSYQKYRFSGLSVPAISA